MHRHLRALPLAAALAAGALAAPTAHAAPEPVNSGQIDWGVKQSFRNYIKGPIAKGSITLSEGATQNADGTFRFPVTSGTHDAAAGTSSVTSVGKVRFTGHGGVLDFTLSDIRVVLDGAAPVLIADAVSKDQSNGQMVTYDDTEFADLNLTAITPATSAGTTTWSTIPAKLTEEGAPAFGGFYSAGTDLDPVTVAHSATAPPQPPTAPVERPGEAAPAPTPVSPAAITAPAPKAKVSLRRLSAAQRRALVGGRSTASFVRVNRAGRVTVLGRARVGGRMRTVARVTRTAGKAGLIQLRWRLSGAARGQLARTGVLRMRLSATQPGGAPPATFVVTLRR